MSLTIYIVTREYEGRYFTNLDAWKIFSTKMGESEAKFEKKSSESQTKVEPISNESDDDLPF